MLKNKINELNEKSMRKNVRIEHIIDDKQILSNNIKFSYTKNKYINSKNGVSFYCDGLMEDMNVNLNENKCSNINILCDAFKDVNDHVITKSTTSSGKSLYFIKLFNNSDNYNKISLNQNNLIVFKNNDELDKNNYFLDVPIEILSLKTSPLTKEYFDMNSRLELDGCNVYFHKFSVILKLFVETKIANAINTRRLTELKEYIKLYIVFVFMSNYLQYNSSVKTLNKMKGIYEEINNKLKLMIDEKNTNLENVFNFNSNLTTTEYLLKAIMNNNNYINQDFKYRKKILNIIKKTIKKIIKLLDITLRNFNEPIINEDKLVVN